MLYGLVPVTYDISREWNSLPASKITSAPSLTVFKRQLNTLVR